VERRAEDLTPRARPRPHRPIPDNLRESAIDPLRTFGLRRYHGQMLKLVKQKLVDKADGDA